MFEVEDKVVVVTGASGGQGAAEAIGLSRAGATVIAVARDDERLRALATRDDLGAGTVVPWQLDVADEAGWETLAAFAQTSHGRVDGLVNNAGIVRRGGVMDTAWSDFDDVERTNLRGPMLAMRALVPLMPPGGSIVNVGSTAGLTAHSSVSYGTTKWALRGLTRGTALELGPSGIRVNAIHPGFIDTPLTEHAGPAFRAANVTASPLGRVGTPDDVVPIVIFLLSDDSSFITGAEIPVDGGITSHGGAKFIADARRAELAR
ncbi:SDR family NAD(P)-dependent oxidoreductase [Microbacterium betulae]|uniref:SDR family NAD(P)-dependent oxidoreductase n=1 Tax=Microbacterium betulae TaxID=2981139 RepID=A0AA97I671_9MICO|nr:SDR family oxidoreductase [Microbacterium sp. AB]WOF22842.1 SDR family NAD(P)-dependent oxidoreductase [Microbacterium sp. AB]